MIAMHRHHVIGNTDGQRTDKVIQLQLQSAIIQHHGQHPADRQDGCIYSKNINSINLE